MHDLIPLKLPFTTLDSKGDYLRLCRTIAREADRIVTVSENSKRDICELLDVSPENVVNTYQSVSVPDKLTSASPDELASILKNLYGLNAGEYFLFVGAVEPKKNLSRLLEAFLGSDIESPLVIAGPNAWMYEQQLSIWDPKRTSSYTLAEGRITSRNRILRLDYVPFPALINLIRGARCLVFPSLYEGFGLPPLEAMALGTPVITSTTSSLPEVTGDAAMLVDPYDVNDIRRALVAMHDMEDTSALVNRGLEQARKFSPEAINPIIQNLYQSLQG
jgi:glycosyltransferase involved in cell wall biosynthesis